MSSDTVSLFLTTVALGLAYMGPTLVADARRHRNVAAIFAFNALLGWTIIGWVLALVWALTDNRR